ADLLDESDVLFFNIASHNRDLALGDTAHDDLPHEGGLTQAGKPKDKSTRVAGDPLLEPRQRVIGDVLTGHNVPADGHTNHRGWCANHVGLPPGSQAGGCLPPLWRGHRPRPAGAKPAITPPVRTAQLVFKSHRGNPFFGAGDTLGALHKLAVFPLPASVGQSPAQQGGWFGLAVEYLLAQLLEVVCVVLG